MKKLVALLLVVTLGVVFTIGCKPTDTKKKPVTPPVERKTEPAKPKPTETPKANEPAAKEGTGPVMPEPKPEPAKSGATKTEPPAPAGKAEPPKK